MPVLFVSHSSKDDAAAGALETRLHANGFTDTFVDHHSIAGGEKWPEALLSITTVSDGEIRDCSCFLCQEN